MLFHKYNSEVKDVQKLKLANVFAIESIKQQMNFGSSCKIRSF